MASRERILVIVACGKSKVWQKEPNRGPTPARDAYIGPPFKVNKEYAETFADRWVILSAKHGFMTPAFKIPGPYDFTFNSRSDKRVTVAELRNQIEKFGLNRFDTVVSLGGQQYRNHIRIAFDSNGCEICFPFEGLRLGEAMQATKRAVRLGEMFPT